MLDVIAVLHGITSHHAASASLAPVPKLDPDAFTLARLVRLQDVNDAREASNALRDAGIQAISLNDVPAVRTGSLPLSHDARIIEVLEDARINVGSVVPIWDDVDYAAQAQDDIGPAELHATTLS